MSEQNDLKSKTLPSLSRRLLSIASARKIKSSGYGKVHEAQKLFRPRINKRKSKSRMSVSSRPAWESNDEGFISPTSSLEDLSSSDSSDVKSRAKWKIKDSKETSSKMLEKLTLNSTSIGKVHHQLEFTINNFGPVWILLLHFWSFWTIF